MVNRKSPCFKPIRFSFFLIVGVGFLMAVLFASCTKPVSRYYVSVTGDDTHVGSKDNPFLSLEKAKSVIADRKAQGDTDGFEIIIMAGTYHMPEPLVFASEESGTAKAPYTIKAADGAEVILSAGVPLQTQWQRHDHQVWKAELAEETAIEGLFAGGKALVRARYPNYQEGIYPFGGYAEDVLSDERISKWANPAGGYIHAMHTGRWGGMHYRIMGKDSSGTLAYEGGWQNNRPSPIHPTQRFVENIFEELDAPGEWFFNKETSILYYIPEQGQAIEEMEFVASRLESIIQLKGTEDNPVTDIHLEGLTFTHTIPTFMKTDEQLMRSDWSIYRNGAVLFDGTERCEVRNGTFKQLGGNAVFVSNYNRQAAVVGNLIEDIGGSAIAFVGNANAVRSPSFRYEEFVHAPGMDTIPGPKTNMYPADCIADNNLIRHIGTIEKQVAGIQIQMASHIKVSQNTIYHVPRAGINIGDGAWGGHIIEHNDVFQTVLETGDHGAFNSWGRDRFWHPDRKEMDSLIKTHPEWILLDAVETTIIRNNRFRCDYGWDIDLDDGSSNYTIYNNLCLSGGLKLREGFYRKVYNNILVNNGFHPHVWFEHSGDVFRGNIVMTAHQPIGITHWGDTVDFNFFASESDLHRMQAQGVETNGMASTLLFKDAANGDFRLQEGSDVFSKAFTNFDMDGFGVALAHLKALADQPEISPIFLQSHDAKGEIVEWYGAKVKNVETLGEQSATGLGEIKGVLFVEVPANSLAEKSGLQTRDVVLVCDGEDTDDVIRLRKAESANRWKGRLQLKVWRNQQLHDIVLTLE